MKLPSDPILARNMIISWVLGLALGILIMIPFTVSDCVIGHSEHGIPIYQSEVEK